MSTSKPTQQGGQQSPVQQQGQAHSGQIQPAPKKPAPQQGGGKVIRDWASI